MEYGFFKTGLFSPKIKVGDINYNVEEIKKGIEIACKKGVEILVYPELSITGATCGDLYYSDVLIDGAKKELVSIAEFTKGKKIIVFLGLPYKKDGKIYNVVAVVSDGKILGLVPKSNFYDFDGFSGHRWFSEFCGNVENVLIDGKEIPFGTKILFCERENEELKIAVEVGEDGEMPITPASNHVLAGATVIVNPCAFYDYAYRNEKKREDVKSCSRRLCCVIAHVNAGNGESTTDTVCAGYKEIAENGEILNESKLFDGDMITADIDVNSISFCRRKLNMAINNGGYVNAYFSSLGGDGVLERTFDKTPFIPNAEHGENEETLLNIQAEGLRKRIEHVHAKTLVIGLSGGLDSTLALLCAERAMKLAGKDTKDIMAITMPCFGTTSRTLDNSIKLARALKVSVKKVDISKSVLRHFKDIKQDESSHDTTYENAQARERTQVLMDIANMTNGLVIGTGDLSETALGWATYNGDHMSNYGVNCSIPKTLVRRLVEYSAEKGKGKLKSVLLDILDTPVSPELLPPSGKEIAQKTEDIVGPYVLHDFYLYCMMKKGYTPKKIYYVAKHTFKSDYKKEEILKWLKTFTRRFFMQQFKRSCVPDGIMVSEISLSPRGSYKMPSDAESTMWLKQLEELE